MLIFSHKDHLQRITKSVQSSPVPPGAITMIRWCARVGVPRIYTSSIPHLANCAQQGHQDSCQQHHRRQSMGCPSIVSVCGYIWIGYLDTKVRLLLHILQTVPILFGATYTRRRRFHCIPFHPIYPLLCLPFICAAQKKKKKRKPPLTNETLPPPHPD